MLRFTRNLTRTKENIIPFASHRAISCRETSSATAGAIQRFSLGFRGPLCLVCGFTGVSPQKFALGAAVGALGTMPLQLTVVSFVQADLL